MPVDRDLALSAEPTTRTIAWTARDTLLYHLSLGAGGAPAYSAELGLTYERDLRVLPTFAIVAGGGISAGDAREVAGLRRPGLDIDLRRILHSGQGVRVHAPIPAVGTATLTTRTAEVWDKGTAALVVLESVAAALDDVPLWTSRMAMWVRGEGGFGGPCDPGADAAEPDREPDLVLDTATTPDQALRYRLNGDLNPLHVDPAVAEAMGFERPILHGLATYGVVALALTRHLLDGDPTRLSGLEARFAGVVLPGDTLRTSIWREDGRLRLRTVDLDRGGSVVLSHATATVAG